MKRLLFVVPLLLTIGCKHDPGGNGSTSLVTPSQPVTQNFPPPGTHICHSIPDPCGGGWDGPSCTYVCPSTCPIMTANLGNGLGVYTVCPD